MRGTTANGHRITPNDQFAALPSRRALSPAGRGDYSVRICTDAGRCATVPVWDVGPWNTTDDYWNPAGTRQSWTNLAQGTPEAQAAYQSGYNGGHDQFGRTVSNPAGIDLADGTFYNVGLNNNGWVTVTYNWTSGGGTGFDRTGKRQMRLARSRCFEVEPQRRTRPHRDAQRRVAAAQRRPCLHAAARSRSLLCPPGAAAV